METLPYLEARDAEDELQFGHDGDVVETLVKAAIYVFGGLLQFGHDGDVVETPAHCAQRSHDMALQFGHDGDVVET